MCQSQALLPGDWLVLCERSVGHQMLFVTYVSTNTFVDALLPNLSMAQGVCGSNSQKGAGEPLTKVLPGLFLLHLPHLDNASHLWM